MKISFTKLLVLLMLIVITFFSCNKRSKNIQYNDISIQDSLNEKGEKQNPLNYKANKKDTILDEINTKKGEVVFLSFYPNMSTKAFEYLQKKEHKKGNLIFSSEYNFEIPLSENNLYFQLKNNQDKLTLHSYNYKKSADSFEVIAESGRKLFDNLKSELINIYCSKYGSYEIRLEEFFSKKYNEKSESRINKGKDSKKYVFKSESKIITLSFKFSSDFFVKKGSRKIRIDDKSLPSSGGNKLRFEKGELDTDPFLGKQQGFEYVGEDTRKSEKKPLKKAYEYKIIIDYYSINSFNQLRSLRTKDSLSSISKLKQNRERRKRLKDSLEKDAIRKLDEVMEKL